MFCQELADPEASEDQLEEALEPCMDDIYLPYKNRNEEIKEVLEKPHNKPLLRLLKRFA